MVEFQGSLLDTDEELCLHGLGASVRRTGLSAGAWVDLRPGWVGGADELFGLLRDRVDWQAERRQMYDKVLDVPRLLHFYGASDPLPHPLLTEARLALSLHYGSELREPFTTAGLCYYRDGRDSVAWHGDRIGRSKTQDTMVAIVSIGTPRPLLLRPTGGGASIRYVLGHGDLLVMGGSCQRTWEHAIPKQSASTGPRISVQFRPRDVR